jgi:hypothetical protein
MLLHQKMASTIIALAMVSLIFCLVRKRRLREEYSLIWIGCALVMLGVVWFYPGLVFVSHLIGAVSHTTTLFLFAFIFVLLLCLHFSISLSRLTTQMKNLTQKISLMEAGERLNRPKETFPEEDT